MKNVWQWLQVSTVQVCTVFAGCFNGDKKSCLNSFKKNDSTVFQRCLRCEKKSCFAVRKGVSTVKKMCFHSGFTVTKKVS